jgi:hypothetical protein
MTEAEVQQFFVDDGETPRKGVHRFLVGLKSGTILTVHGRPECDEHRGIMTFTHESLAEVDGFPVYGLTVAMDALEFAAQIVEVYD